MLTWTAIRGAWAPTPPSACPLALRMSWDGLLEHGWRTWCARKRQEINCGCYAFPGPQAALCLKRDEREMRYCVGASRVACETQQSHLSHLSALNPWCCIRARVHCLVYEQCTRARIQHPGFKAATRFAPILRSINRP